MRSSLAARNGGRGAHLIRPLGARVRGIRRFRTENLRNHAPGMDCRISGDVAHDSINIIKRLHRPDQVFSHFATGSLAASDGFVAAVHWRVIRAKITSPVGGAVTVIQNSY